MKSKVYTKKDAINYILDMVVFSSIAENVGDIIKKSPPWVREALRDATEKDFDHEMVMRKAKK